MSEHLQKAKGALDQAAERFAEEGMSVGVADLLSIARVQAEVAQAETLERLLEHFAYPPVKVMS